MPAGQHASIESLHERRSGEVVHFPKAGHHAPGTGVHKSTGKPDNSLPLQFLPQSRLAGAEHHQLGGQIEIVDVREPEESANGLALAIHQAEHQPTE